MKLPSEAILREVGPRDGFQSLQRFIPTDQKVRIIETLARTGLRNIEATSFVSPKAIPQLRDATEVMSRVPRKGIKHSALVPNLKGAQNAIAAGVDDLVVVISASEVHNQANLRRSISDSLADLEPIFALAREKGLPVNGAVAVSFGCPYQGDVPSKDVFKIVEAFILKGAAAIFLADTTGMATPTRIEEMVGSLRDRFGDIELVLHLHNNRGNAMANLLAALLAGVTIFDTAIGGIGGCPNVPKASGNLATEDVVYMLEEMGISTGIDLNYLIVCAQLVEKIVGQTLPGQVMKSGPRDPELAARICGIDHSI